MSKTEYRFSPTDERDIVDWLSYGGVNFPKYLITEESLAARLAKSGKIIEHIREELAKGSPGGDALNRGRGPGGRYASRGTCDSSDTGDSRFRCCQQG